ncbi:MAG: ATP-binding cassette domain-containing protein [Opitutales bacterium]|nr:ATP-binding cassette domain-containing protein [Opitutales bacterium]
MAEIQLRNLSKTFDNGFRALDNLCLTVRDGEFLTVVGPSGCGKTTLLRTLAGLESPTSGEILVGDKVINHLEPKDRKMGMVFQNYALFPHLSAYDNMAFGLKARKKTKAEIQRFIQPVAQRLEIQHLLERKPNQLSGGQRQRVALGRLLAKNPSIHLLDEPLSNLDAHLRAAMRRELKILHKEYGKTTLFVTHDQTEAMTLGHRICVMKEGHIEQTGTPHEIYHEPANLFVAGFFGSPPINLVAGKVGKSSNNQSYFEGLGTALAIPDEVPPPPVGNLTLGIHAEDIEVATNTEVETGQVFELCIETIDDLGEAKIIHTKCGEAKISVRAEYHTPLKDNIIQGRFNWTKVLWFNPQTGERIP